MTEAPKHIVCSPDTIEELIPVLHERPDAPACARTDRYVLGALALPPCAEVGYCVAPHLGE